MSEIAVNFQAHGIANVLQAFATIDKRAEKFGATITRNERIITSSVTKETDKQRDAHVKAYDRVSQAYIKLTQKMIQESKRLADRKIKETERSVKAEIRLEDQAQKAYERSVKNRTKEFERETKKMNRIAESAARERARTEGAAAKAGAQRMRSFGTNASSLVTSAGGRVLGGLGTAAAGIMAVGGGFSAVDAVQTGVRNRGRAADIAIASGGELSKSEVYSRAANAATAYGTSTENALAATDRLYAKGGNAKLALDLMPNVLALATATGGDAGEIGEVAGQIYNADKSLSAEQVDAVARGWAGQGRAGSVDMRELAQYGSRIAAGAASFGGDKAENMVKLGGIVQMATAGGASSAAEATESAAHIGHDVYKNRLDFAAMGINPFDKNGNVIDPEELIKKSVSKTKGNEGGLMKLFGLQSVKAVAGAGNIFKDKYIKTKDAGGSEAEAVAAGDKALAEAFQKWKEAALTEKQVREDAAKRLAETDKKVEAAMNLLREKVADVLIPKLTELLPKLTDLIPEFANLLSQVVAVAEWMSKNPFKAIVALIAASVAKDVAAAGLGKLLAKIFSTVGNGTRFGAGGAGAPIAGLGGKVTRGGLGLAGNIGGGLAIAGAAVGVAEAGMAGIEMVLAANQKGRDNDIRADLEASSAASAASSMKGGSEGNLAKKKAALEAAQKQMASTIDKQQNSIGDTGIFENLMGSVTTFFGSDASKTKKDAEQRTLDQTRLQFDKLAETLKLVDEALAKVATTSKKVEIKDPKNTVPLSGDARTK